MNWSRGGGGWGVWSTKMYKHHLKEKVAIPFFLLLDAGEKWDELGEKWPRPLG